MRLEARFEQCWGHGVKHPVSRPGHTRVLYLWIIRVEVNKQLGIREMPETQTIIRHCVRWATNVIVGSKVAVVMLMQAGYPEQVCGRFFCGGGTFLRARDRRHVVIEYRDGLLSDIESLGQETSWCITMPASSKSLFVRSPCGFCHVTSRFCMYTGNSALHRMGAWLFANHTPPMPVGLSKTIEDGVYCLIPMIWVRVLLLSLLT
jgi:hypothetical protein